MIDPDKANIEFVVSDQPLSQLMATAFNALVPSLTKAALPDLVNLISNRPIADFDGLPVASKKISLTSSDDSFRAGVDLR